MKRLGLLLAFAAALLFPVAASAQITGPGTAGALVGSRFNGGKLTMPLLAPKSATNTSPPGYAFNGSTTTGMGFDGTYLFFANQGTRIFYATNTALGFDLPILQQDGLVTSPTYAFLGDPATGMFRTAGGTLGFAAGGSLNFTVASNFVVIGNAISLDTLRGANILTISARLNTPLHTPATSSEACTAGDWSADTGFVYICTATNTWKRSALSSF